MKSGRVESSIKHAGVVIPDSFACNIRHSQTTRANKVLNTRLEIQKVVASNIIAVNVPQSINATFEVMPTNDFFPGNGLYTLSVSTGANFIMQSLRVAYYILFALKGMNQHLSASDFFRRITIQVSFELAQKEVVSPALDKLLTETFAMNRLASGLAIRPSVLKGSSSSSLPTYYVYSSGADSSIQAYENYRLTKIFKNEISNRMASATIKGLILTNGFPLHDCSYTLYQEKFGKQGAGRSSSSSGAMRQSATLNQIDANGAGTNVASNLSQQIRNSIRQLQQQGETLSKKSVLQGMSRSRSSLSPKRIEGSAGSRRSAASSAGSFQSSRSIASSASSSTSRYASAINEPVEQAEQATLGEIQSLLQQQLPLRGRRESQISRRTTSGPRTSFALSRAASANEEDIAAEEEERVQEEQVQQTTVSTVATVQMQRLQVMQKSLANLQLKQSELLLLLSKSAVLNKQLIALITDFVQLKSSVRSSLVTFSKTDKAAAFNLIQLQRQQRINFTSQLQLKVTEQTVLLTKFSAILSNNELAAKLSVGAMKDLLSTAITMANTFRQLCLTKLDGLFSVLLLSFNHVGLFEQCFVQVAARYHEKLENKTFAADLALERSLLVASNLVSQMYKILVVAREVDIKLDAMVSLPENATLPPEQQQVDAEESEWSEDQFAETFDFVQPQPLVENPTEPTQAQQPNVFAEALGPEATRRTRESYIDFSTVVKDLFGKVKPVEPSEEAAATPEVQERKAQQERAFATVNSPETIQRTRESSAAVRQAATLSEKFNALKANIFGYARGPAIVIDVMEKAAILYAIYKAYDWCSSVTFNITWLQVLCTWASAKGFQGLLANITSLGFWKNLSITLFGLCSTLVSKSVSFAKGALSGVAGLFEFRRQPPRNEAGGVDVGGGGGGGGAGGGGGGGGDGGGGAPGGGGAEGGGNAPLNQPEGSAAAQIESTSQASATISQTISAEEQLNELLRNEATIAYEEASLQVQTRQIEETISQALPSVIADRIPTSADNNLLEPTLENLRNESLDRLIDQAINNVAPESPEAVAARTQLEFAERKTLTFAREAIILGETGTKQLPATRQNAAIKGILRVQALSREQAANEEEVAQAAPAVLPSTSTSTSSIEQLLTKMPASTDELAVEVMNAQRDLQNQGISKVTFASSESWKDARSDLLGEGVELQTPILQTMTFDGFGGVVVKPSAGEAINILDPNTSQPLPSEQLLFYPETIQGNKVIVNGSGLLKLTGLSPSYLETYRTSGLSNAARANVLQKIRQAEFGESALPAIEQKLLSGQPSVTSTALFVPQPLSESQRTLQLLGLPVVPDIKVVSLGRAAGPLGLPSPAAVGTALESIPALTPNVTPGALETFANVVSIAQQYGLTLPTTAAPESAGLYNNILSAIQSFVNPSTSIVPVNPVGGRGLLPLDMSANVLGTTPINLFSVRTTANQPIRDSADLFAFLPERANVRFQPLQQSDVSRAVLSNGPVAISVDDLLKVVGIPRDKLPDLFVTYSVKQSDGTTIQNIYNLRTYTGDIVPLLKSFPGQATAERLTSLVGPLAVLNAPADYLQAQAIRGDQFASLALQQVAIAPPAAPAAPLPAPSPIVVYEAENVCDATSAAGLSCRLDADPGTIEVATEIDAQVKSYEATENEIAKTLIALREKVPVEQVSNAQVQQVRAETVIESATKLTDAVTDLIDPKLQLKTLLRRTRSLTVDQVSKLTEEQLERLGSYTDEEFSAIVQTLGPAPSATTAAASAASQQNTNALIERSTSNIVASDSSVDANIVTVSNANPASASLPEPRSTWADTFKDVVNQSARWLKNLAESSETFSASVALDQIAGGDVQQFWNQVNQVGQVAGALEQPALQALRGLEGGVPQIAPPTPF